MIGSAAGEESARLLRPGDDEVLGADLGVASLGARVQLARAEEVVKEHEHSRAEATVRVTADLGGAQGARIPRQPDAGFRREVAARDGGEEARAAEGWVDEDG